MRIMRNCRIQVKARRPLYKPALTPDVQSPRGPERLMIGGGKEVYYTPDYYKTFVRLNIAR
ncbi:MAG TPA: hypothetical protein DCZ93_07725 [Elusimicrobia bacterium]|nr:hypothetical protein [Elusimicrobiota bacterium]